MKRHVTAAWCVLVLSVGVLLVGGCESQVVMVPRDRGLIGDVPVPTAYKFDAEHSSGFNRQGTGERYANYHYTGRAPFPDVEAFYKQQMPVNGWKLDQDVSAGGRKTLYFRKLVLTGDAADVPTCLVTIFAVGEYATAIQIVRTER